MILKPGLRLVGASSGVALIVIKAASTDVEIACDDEPLTPLTDDNAGRPAPAAKPTASAGVALGKRYEDLETGIELLCTHPGGSVLTCDGRPMTLRTAKPLPASD